MPKPLVIVESPAKARTIARYLGGDFVVESSIGHVRDLPRNAADVPASHKGQALDTEAKAEELATSVLIRWFDDEHGVDFDPTNPAQVH